MREFDYYIYIDYSENLVGYSIINKENVKELLLRISKLHHYKKLKHKREYLNSMKRLFENENLTELLLKWKIKSMKCNLELFLEVVEFVEEHDNCIIFMSVDDNQYYSFRKLIKMIQSKKNLVIVKESKLKKDTIEYKMSLIIDTLLNMRRRKLSK